MPLGKLSKSQIQDAYKVLTQLQNMINSAGDQLDPHSLVAHTNKFYTLIPHDFGVNNPPLLNNLETIKVHQRSILFFHFFSSKKFINY